MILKNCLIPTKENDYKAYLLRKVSILIYSFILIFVNSFGGLLGINQAYASAITPNNIIYLTNQERGKLGLTALTSNAKLSAAAQAKANDMFAKQYWDHFGPNGETPWQFIRGAGYSYVYAGENLAKGFRTSEGVVEAWMASPTHKANIVSGNYKEIGVAVMDGVLLGKQVTLVVQMFGTVPSETQSNVGNTQSQETQTQGVQTPPPAQPITKPKQTVIQPKEEKGDIRTISVTSPTQDSTYNDPSITVKGKASNTSGQYSVDIYEADQIIATGSAEGSNWEVKKGADWKEGAHTIKANIKGSEISSPNVSFTIDSTPPVFDINTLKVEEDNGKYKLFFKIEDKYKSMNIIAGSKIIPIKSEDPQNISIELNEEDVLDKSVKLTITDDYENSTNIDISDYFVKKEKVEEKNFFTISSIGLSDGITLALVLFVFVLLCIEIYIYWKNGMIKKAVGDLFTIGIWWILLTIVTFGGFAGNIN